MAIENTVVKDLNEYQQVLNQHGLVFALFVSDSCQACALTRPNFEKVAAKYAHAATSIILKTEDSPRVDGVTGTPTLVVYKNALEVENLKGIGYPQEQEEILENLFRNFLPDAPAAPASPAAPPPSPR